MSHARLLFCIIALIITYYAAATTTLSREAATTTTTTSTTTSTTASTDTTSDSDSSVDSSSDLSDVPENALFFYPPSCAANYYANDTDAECCPTASNGLVCGGSTRGSCANPFETGYCKDSSYFSTFWISDWFERVCVCEEGFWGVDCGDCRPGWTGTNCDEPLPLRVRKSAQKLTEEEQTTLSNVFQALHETPHEWWPQISQWNWMASLHAWAVSPKFNNGSAIHTKTVDYAGGPSQGAWHRSYTWLFERRCQAILNDYTWSLPYWPLDDSVAGSDADVMANILGFFETGAAPYTCNVQAACDETLTREAQYQCCNCTLRPESPFAQWKATTHWGRLYTSEYTGGPLPLQRAFGCLPRSTLPSTETLKQDRLLKFVEFADLMWWTHAMAHKWVGITMAALSPVGEPLFWPLHSWFDRVFEQWIRRADEEGVLARNNMMFAEGAVGQSQDDCMVPLVPLARNIDFFLPSYSFGYTYDIFEENEPYTETTRFIMPEIADQLVIDSDDDGFFGEEMYEWSNSLTITTHQIVEKLTATTDLEINSENLDMLSNNEHDVNNDDPVPPPVIDTNENTPNKQHHDSKTKKKDKKHRKIRAMLDN